jgi:VanZ family protein
MRARNFVSKWVPVIAWMLLIFAGSTDMLSAEHTSRFLVPFLRWLDPQISFATIAVIHVALRKLGHFTEYVVLAVLLWRALRSALRSTRAIAVAEITFAVSVLFAASDEFHQSFVATRTASENDVVVDICGAVVAIAICWVIESGKHQRGKTPS